MQYIIIILFLILNNFFGAIPIPLTITTLMLFYFVFRGVHNASIYRIPFLIILIGIICAFISCRFYRGQSFIDSFKAIPAFYGLLFYYFLKYKRIKLKTIERSMVILIAIFDTVYIMQYYLIDYGINFLSIDEWQLSDEFGGNRLRVISSGLYSLGIFYGIVQWYQKKQAKYLILFVLGIFIMFLAGYRQLFASLAITLIFMFYKVEKKFKAKHIGMLLFTCITLYFTMQIPAVQEKIAGMIERNNEGASLMNSDYIRVIQWNFFMNDFFKSGFEYVFGAGIPFTESAYGKYFESLQLSGIQYVDWGILGISWMLGITTVIGIIMFSVKAMRLKVPPAYSYICLWYLFLLLSSITNYEFFRNGNFLVHAICLYIVEISAKKYAYEKDRFLPRK